AASTSTQQTTQRLLPSQRAGSYQSQAAQPGGRGSMDGAGGAAGGGGGTAQERLKARLWGRASPTGGGGGAGAATQGQGV
ncbi:hypothetical protein LTR60_006596, partial [Cryomyces antarcticus]